ncbi:MAG: ABC transporter permease [Chloroflexota bacterium]|nr:ABC transporter permease [Chloroflexota bacterium]
MRFRRNKPAIVGGAIIAIMVLTALFSALLSPYNPSTQDYSHLVQPPGSGHLLGTDDLGRDVLSRIIYGARVSVASSIVPVAIALGVGVPLGLIAGFYRGFLDDWLIMRVVDAMQAFPFLILALALASVLGAGFWNAMIAIGIGFIPAFIRIVRGQVLAVSTLEYIEAARALGVGNSRILRSHVLPNALGPLLVQTSIASASAILAEAGLAFLGVGVEPGTPSWGQMLTVSQAYINSAPWLAVWPGIAIFLAVLGFNLLGDGIREGLDPRLG